MKRIFFFAFVLLSMQLTHAALPELGWGPVITTGLNLYVSTTGADTNDGSINTPFKTVAKAQTYIRTLKTTTGLPTNGITVWIRSGRYQMAPLLFTSADNGEMGKPIIYRAYPNESVSIFTGKPINPANWKPLNADARLRVNPKVNPDSLREIDIAAMGVSNTNPFPDSFTASWSIFDFVVNNQRQPISQWPNLDENIRQINDPGWTTCNGSKDVLTFYYGPGGKPADGNSTNELDLDGTNRAERWRSSMAGGHNLWLKGFWRQPWSPTTVRVAEVNTQGNWIKLAVNADAGMGSKYSANADAAGTYRVGDGKEKWIAINYLDEIDSPGEWAYDFKDKKVYYYPSTDLSKADAYFADNSTAVIYCNGVSYMRFIGLTIEGGQGSGFTMANTSNIFVGGCTIRNVGSHGVFDNGGMNNTYQGNNFYETGAVGIYLYRSGSRSTLTPSNSSVLNNHVHHTGKLATGYAVVISECVGVTMSHNLIHDVPAGGVMCSAVNSFLEYNEIHNVALKASDMGCFYDVGQWTTYGNEVRYNFVHHANRANGYYSDDGASGYNYYNNIAQGILNPFLTGGGHHVIGRNNLIVDALKASSIDERGISRSYFVSSATYGGQVRAINPRSEPWLSFGKQLVTKYGYAANDTLWGCTLDSLWHPEYPNGCKLIDNVEVNPKGFSKPTHGTVTVANNVSIATVAAAGFFDYANLDLRTNNTTVLGKFPNLNTVFPLIGLILDDYRVRVVTKAEVGGLSNRGAAGDPWNEDPVHP
ncbi:MAG: right-handed parallel beta-helix repeat-containing protein [Paludibacter sp.]